MPHIVHVREQWIRRWFFSRSKTKIFAQTVSPILTLSLKGRFSIGRKYSKVLSNIEIQFAHANLIKNRTFILYVSNVSMLLNIFGCVLFIENFSPELYYWYSNTATGKRYICVYWNFRYLVLIIHADFSWINAKSMAYWINACLQWSDRCRINTTDTSPRIMTFSRILPKS